MEGAEGLALCGEHNQREDVNNEGSRQTEIHAAVQHAQAYSEIRSADLGAKEGEGDRNM